jgi:hypothetical protein
LGESRFLTQNQEQDLPLYGIPYNGDFTSFSGKAIPSGNDKRQFPFYGIPYNGTIFQMSLVI